MKPKSLPRLITEVAGEERNLTRFKEIPCKDMDLDCFALDGQVPFGSYKKCYEYAPELGRCIFCEWHQEGSGGEQ